MPEFLDPDQLALRDKCHQFAKDHLIQNITGQATATRDEIVRFAKETGIYRMTQPKAFGGLESSQIELCVAREALASYNPNNLGACFGPSPGVLGAASGPLVESHLKPLMDGKIRGSFGFTEPDNVSPTSAQEDGDLLRINGQKSYVTGGEDADFINTLVQIEGKGPSMVVVDTSCPGVVIEEKFTSLDGSHHAAFQFKDVEVPQFNVIGSAGQGLPKAMKQIGDTRLLFAAEASGFALWVLALLKDHLQSKDKSGTARGNKEVVRWQYANLRIKAYALRSMLYRTARLADSGENIVNEAMATKVFATEAIGEMVDTAIQLVGGVALVEDHPLAILYKKVRAWRLAEGASDVLRLNIGRGILELEKGRI